MKFTFHPVKAYSFHMKMFLILLIFRLTNVFAIFQEPA